MTQLKLSNIDKSYGNGVCVLKDINLDINSGELLVFVGPSGCGKSTLLRMIAGLETITAGELQINGQSMNDMPPSKRGIAMVFQSYALYPHLTVRENMAFALKIAKQSPAQIDAAVDNAAAKPPAATKAITQLGKLAIAGLANTIISRSTFTISLFSGSAVY